jgi:VanZ family protein
VTDPTPSQSVGQHRRLLRHAVALLATAVLAVTIAFLTLSPPTLDLRGSLPDKLYHFTAFAALAFPCALLYARILVWVLPAALLFGGVIELIQPYIGRSGEGADFLADVLGVIFGAALGLTLRAVRAKKKQARAATGA